MLHLGTALCTLLVLAFFSGASASELSEETDGIIVRMESDPLAVQESAFSVQSATAADAAGDLGVPIGDHLRRITLQPGDTLKQQLERLQHMTGIRYAVPDLPIYPERVKVGEQDVAANPKPGDDDVAATLAGLSKHKSFSLQWGASRIGLPSAWSIAIGAASKEKSINVCVVDSGVDLKHPDLVSNFVQGFSAVNGDDEDKPADEVGHGTTVHGVIAASGADGGVLGVNWNNVNVMPCKFMSADGWGRTSDAIQCMDWCLEQKADIISASWSCGELGNPPLQEAVARTHEAGVLLVIAAGNQGANMRRTPYYPQAYAKEYDNVLVVGATDEYDEHAFFSNYDPDIVHLSAPGRWIYTTTVGGGYNFTSGTSIAAPFVSGSAALLMAVAQDKLGKMLSALEVKTALLESVEQLKELVGRTATGGRLRTDWALQRLLGHQLSPPMPCVAKPGDRSKCRDNQSTKKKRQQHGVGDDQTARQRRTRRMQASALPAN